MGLRAYRPGDEEPPEALLARLEARLDTELRAEQADYEQLAAKGVLRDRDLAAVALDLLFRGDLVAVEMAALAVTGRVVHAAGDLLVVATAGGEVDVNLAAPLSLTVVERVPSGGSCRGAGPRSFKARLCEHEASGRRLELGTRLPGRAVSGVLSAVARDHVVVDGPPRRIVALSALEFVRGHPRER